MNDNDTGGPAFPVSTRPMECEVGYGHQDSNSTWQFGGMTLRDYFAAQALQGVLATINDFGNNKKDVFTTLSVFSYMMADAMLEARK